MHPAVLLSRTGKTWVENLSTGSDFPAGWMISYTDPIAKAELVVCYERTNATPSGKTCDMKDKDDKPFAMTLYNTDYRLRVRQARTGQVVYDKPGTATRTDCPYLTYTSADDDPTKYYTDASPADYRGEIKPLIAP